MEYIQFLTVITLVSLGQATTSCFDNQVYHFQNGKCCQYVRCEPQHFVKVCENSGETDVCKPCPEDSYLDDHTDSNFVFDCLDKNCGEDTVPSNYPATKFDNTACPKRCRCNTAKNYCGTDPCQCRYHVCVHPEEELQENCTCIRKEKVNDDTNLITPLTKSSTAEQGRVSQYLPPGPTISSTSLGAPNIVNETRNDKEEDIITPRWKENQPGGKEPTKVRHTPSIFLILLIIILTCICIVILLFVVFVYCCKNYIRRRGKDSNATILYHNIQQHQTIHTYDNCNVQIGNKNTLNVCDMGENVDSETSE